MLMLAKGVRAHPRLMGTRSGPMVCALVRTHPAVHFVVCELYQDDKRELKMVLGQEADPSGNKRSGWRESAWVAHHRHRS